MQSCSSSARIFAIRQSPSARRHRRGSLMVEAGAALMMLAIAMTLTVKVVGWVAQELRATDRRQLALAEASNLMERLSAMSYDSLNSGSVKSLGLSSTTKAALPDASLELGIDENDPSGGSGSKKVALRIRWKNRAGVWDAPVLLTTWIYRSPSP